MLLGKRRSWDRHVQPTGVKAVEYGFTNRVLNTLFQQAT